MIKVMENLETNADLEKIFEYYKCSFRDSDGNWCNAIFEDDFKKIIHQILQDFKQFENYE